MALPIEARTSDLIEMIMSIDTALDDGGSMDSQIEVSASNIVKTSVGRKEIVESSASLLLKN